MRLLAAFGDSTMAKSVSLLVSGAGFQIETVSESDEALDLAKLYDFDLVILGDELLDDNALWVLRQMRIAKVPTPVLLLSEDSTVRSIVEALQSGADDYLTVPFHKDELTSRIHAIIRRSKGHASPLIEIGPMVLDLDDKTVKVRGRQIPLTGKEYAMLELLAVRRGVTLSKETFLNHLYGGMDEPELKIVDVFICKLRKKLLYATGSQFIETVWGRGYVLRDEPVPPRELNGAGQHSDKVDPLSTRRGMILRELLNAPMSIGETSEFLNCCDFGSVSTSMANMFSRGELRKTGNPRSRDEQTRLRFHITDLGKAWLTGHGYDVEQRAVAA